jgi:4-diphosphocytidyl-2C-methyl-D-erythritol kinase
MGALISMMSGSGSSVFGVFSNDAGVTAGLAPGVQAIETRTSERVFRVELE